MSSYGFYLFVDAVRDLVSALAPVLVAVVLAVAALIGWRWYLARGAGAEPARLLALERRVRRLELEHDRAAGRRTLSDEEDGSGGAIAFGKHPPEHRKQPGENRPDQEADDTEPGEAAEGREQNHRRV